MSDQRKIIQKNDTEDEVNQFFKKAAIAVGVGAVVALGAPKLIDGIGFAKDGIRKESLAATFQSNNYGGETPKESVFSSLQRTGVNGLSTSESVGLGVSVGAAVLGLIIALTPSASRPHRRSTLQTTVRTAGRVMSDQRKTSQKDNTEDDSFNFWAKVAGAVVGGAALAYGAGKVINSLGFEEDGIRKDSPASRYQSKNYGPETPKEGLFPSLQSTGATGISTKQVAGTIAATGLAIFAASAMGKSSEKKE